MKIQLGKNLDQSGIFLNGDAMAFRQCNDLFGDQARSLGRHFGSLVLGRVVPQCDRPFHRFF